MQNSERPPPASAAGVFYASGGAYGHLIYFTEGGALVSYFLGWNEALEALLVLMVIDYMTGLLAAYINPNMQLNSNRGFRGICKKIMILLLIVLAHELEKATGIPAVQSIVVWFFIGNEGLSIIENAAKAGIPVPAKLRDTLEQLQNEKKGATK